MHYFKTILKDHLNSTIAFFWSKGCSIYVVLVKRSAGKLSAYFEQFKRGIFVHEGSVSDGFASVAKEYPNLTAATVAATTALAALAASAGVFALLGKKDGTGLGAALSKTKASRSFILDIRAIFIRVAVFCRRTIGHVIGFDDVKNEASKRGGK